MRGRTSQHGRRKSKYRSKSRVNKKNAECWGCHKKGHFERDCPMSKSKEKAIGIGSVRVRCHDGTVRTITEVRNVPDLKKDLISLGTLDKQGYKYMSEGGTMKVTKGSLVMLKAKLEDGLYTFARSTIIDSVNASTVQLSNDDKAKLWHMRLGLMSTRGLEMLRNRNLLNGEKINTLEFYEHCVLGKQKKVSFNIGKHKTGGVLYYIHLDLWVPSKLPSKGGKRQKVML
ncbi:hypothetical protein KY290_008041 [Solanum tuberosum]|uniref:CCHC-type domain-containing protein n=1 Tax=Solanum tuberosum TaxID=4113 RepID=A0ABQ7W7R8_SOLTU|nr:hypothetical protein KY290_008041 [Solanum tuberosum]